MWTKSEKYLALGVGYSIWGCVIGTPIVGILFTVVGICYFCASIFTSVKGE